jgi:hypothetical protein
MNEIPPHNSNSQQSKFDEGISQQIENSSVDGGIQTTQGDHNIQVQGNENTLNILLNNQEAGLEKLNLLQRVTKKLYEKWIEVTVTLLVGITLTGILLFGGKTIDSFKRYYAVSRNISQEEAIAVAREVIGANTREVIPFTSKDSDSQYIAVIAKPTPDQKNKSTLNRDRVYILEGINKVYRVLEIDLTAYDMFFFNSNEISNPSLRNLREKDYLKSIFGVVDLNNDGNYEVYSIYRQGGSGAYNFDIKIYEPLSG